MKLLVISLLIIPLLLFGCSTQKQAENKNYTSQIKENTTFTQALNIGENEPSTKSTNIEERYKLVDKKTLKYEIKNSDYYSYETADTFVESGLLSEIPNIDNKTYGSILTSYTYESEINPTNVSFDKAISLAKSLLPDDIKEERIKKDPYTSKYYIVYSSTIGNFVLGLVPEDPMNPTDTPLSSKNIVGIDYMKEIKK